MISEAVHGYVHNPLIGTRIVGIGASAGGLEALEKFLANIPPKTGMAYIVVQHLDPHKKTLLVSLLQRVTSLPVCQAENSVRVRPDSIYVIPPNTEISVVHHSLKLAPLSEERALRLPVDVLFSSLAGAQGERAIGVVLSGMGFDGTLGLQAIKAVGGLTVVQQPETAGFDSMPRSAIAAGCADIIGPPAELPGHIMAYIRQLPEIYRADEDGELVSEPLHRILMSLQRRTGHDFFLYKSNTQFRRIERRMAIHNIGTLARYAEFLEKNPQEIDLLFKELLIGVTSFFRDKEVWACLAETALPQLLAQREGNPNLRAWIVGCSTGEEAYSLAMVFIEVLEKLSPPVEFTLQIFASDLSPDAIAIARRGHYPESISTAVSPERLSRFFRAHDGHYQINKNIRDMVLFAQHDVVLDPPFTRVDLLTCRNLLIYFNLTLQRRLLPLFHYSLNPGGLLMLGASETPGRLAHLFTPIDPKLRLYMRQSNASNGRTFLLDSFPPLSRITRELDLSTSAQQDQLSDNLQKAADQVLLQQFAPAAVLVNRSGDIIYISGRTGKYLEPAAGRANWNFHAMVRKGLRLPLTEAMARAGTSNEKILLRGLQVQLPDGSQEVDVTVQALEEPAPLRDMLMFVFYDVPPGTPGRVRHTQKGKGSVEADTHDSQHYHDQIQILHDEARTATDELQLANEELQSTNEELQSTNEELTTSKEEMQSMNEELQTINTELQTKLDELSLAQSDMQNLLNSIEIAILFLDQKLNVRRFTERASEIFSLRSSDLGRPLSDLTTRLKYPALYDDAEETLRTLAFCEKQILSDDERWYSVRILPYRRPDNVIDGVIITFVDITNATRKLEEAMRQDSRL
jgi:two-component system CheB/CheR fusion protein